MSHSRLKKTGKIVICVFAIIGIAGSVFAWKFHGGMDRHSERWVSHVESEFNLNAEQSQSLSDLKSLIIDIGREAKQGRRQQMTEVMDLMLADEMDQQQAIALVEDKTAIVENKATQIIVALADFSNQLSANQKREMRDKIERKMQKWN